MQRELVELNTGRHPVPFRIKDFTATTDVQAGLKEELVSRRMCAFAVFLMMSSKLIRSPWGAPLASIATRNFCLQPDPRRAKL